MDYSLSSRPHPGSFGILYFAFLQPGPRKCTVSAEPGSLHLFSLLEQDDVRFLPRAGNIFDPMQRRRRRDKRPPLWELSWMFF